MTIVKLRTNIILACKLNKALKIGDRLCRHLSLTSNQYRGRMQRDPRDMSHEWESTCWHAYSSTQWTKEKENHEDLMGDIDDEGKPQEQVSLSGLLSRKHIQQHNTLKKGEESTR